MSHTFAIARLELLIVRRNLWVGIAVCMMSLFAIVLTLAGSSPAGVLGADRLSVTVANLTTLSVYLVPIIALLLSFDAVAGEVERGTLPLTLAYPVSRIGFLFGKLSAHVATLAFALFIGFGIAALLSIWSDPSSTTSLGALVALFASAVLLGTAFLGFGYMISATIRHSAAAAGLAIGIWLFTTVLYDLGLLGALVADDSGFFSTHIFPWLLVANPADAFRIVNLEELSAATTASGFAATRDALPKTAPLIALFLWPPSALAGAWCAFRRLEL